MEGWWYRMWLAVGVLTVGLLFEAMIMVTLVNWSIALDRRQEAVILKELAGEQRSMWDD